MGRGQAAGCCGAQNNRADHRTVALKVNVREMKAVKRELPRPCATLDQWSPLGACEEEAWKDPCRMWIRQPVADGIERS